MQLTVDLDPDVYDLTSAYAGEKGITLSEAIGQLIRRSEQTQPPEHGSGRLRLNEHGYYELAARPGMVTTPEMVRDFLEGDLD